MTMLCEQWRLDVISHTDRMTSAAMDEIQDRNEASMMVHDVMARAMTDMLAPISRRELDTALGRALRAHALL